MLSLDINNMELVHLISMTIRYPQMITLISKKNFFSKIVQTLYFAKCRLIEIFILFKLFCEKNI